MKEKNPVFLFAISLFISFLVLSFFVFIDIFSVVDLLVTQILQEIIPRRFDMVFSLFSLFGSFEIVSLILLSLWYLYRKLNLFYILFLFGAFHVLELFGKLFINQPNPPSEFFRYDIPFSFASSFINTGSSFPSGHMGRTVFVSIIVALILSKSKRFSSQQKYLIYFLIFVFDLIMFISRIYLGEHWFSDVIGGSLLGASFALFSLALFSLFKLGNSYAPFLKSFINKIIS